MNDMHPQYVFPKLERELVTKTSYLLVPLELLIHGLCIYTSIRYKNLDGIWLSVFFTVMFGLVHYLNLRYRKYCLAKWAFDGTSFHVCIGNETRSVDTSQLFCVSTAMLSFSRRYLQEKYPFIMLWRPGQLAPYEEMNGYSALKKRQALILPYNEVTLEILNQDLQIMKIPQWPKSAVFQGRKGE